MYCYRAVFDIMKLKVDIRATNLREVLASRSGFFFHTGVLNKIFNEKLNSFRRGVE